MKKYKSSQYNIVVSQDDKGSIVYNSFSGGIIKLENDVLRELYARENIYEDFPYFENLKREGYIVDSAIDEFNRIDSLIQQQSKNLYPKEVNYVIAPTLNCNLHCVYCFQKDVDICEKTFYMSSSVIEKVLKYIVKSNIDNKNLKTINITWFGGEPMLCYDKILEFSNLLREKLKDSNIEMTSRMVTNGTLLNEKRINALIEIANLKHIQITIDGSEKNYCSKKQTDSSTFNKVIENIVLATQNLKTTVRVNADKSNFEDLISVSQMLYAKCYNNENLKIHFAQLRDYNNECDDCFYSDDEYQNAKFKFYQNLYEKGCISQKPNIGLQKFSMKPFCGLKSLRNFVIDPYGNLYKCEHNLGDKTKIIGDVENGIYYNEEYRNFFEDKKPTKCSKCEIFPFCNYAFCPAMQSLTGDKNCKHYNTQLKAIKDKCNKFICKEIK